MRDGVTYASEPLTYSVLRYAQNMLVKTDNDALKTLLVNMLQYGAFAQKYFGYNAANPVTAALTEAQRDYGNFTMPRLRSCKERIEHEDCPIRITSCTLLLRERVSIIYSFDLSDFDGAASDLQLAITWQDATGADCRAVIDGARFVTEQGRCSVIFDGLNAAQMRTVCSAELQLKQNGNCVSDTVLYSIESYAASKASDSDALLRALTAAMMNYGDATAAYCEN